MYIPSISMSEIIATGSVIIGRFANLKMYRIENQGTRNQLNLADLN
jgi:hypothetical protein